MPDFVSRGGLKLDHALRVFDLDVAGFVCADLGSNTGGFVDVLLQRGAAKVYSIDTGYGVLAWKLRKDPRVIVMERTNAMHAALPEPVQLVTIDVAWTKQKHILPAAKKLLTPGGICVTLIKPHYEADPKLLKQGILPSEELPNVVEALRPQIESCGFAIEKFTDSPIKGAKGNAELLALLRPKHL
jgi:23S rRNA (cytidine1920-2'-O)/16S rRNA (cytidine1409-2'-O)-methyltransferase